MAGKHEKDEREETRGYPADAPKNAGKSRSAQDRDTEAIKDARAGDRPAGRHAARDEQDRT